MTVGKNIKKYRQQKGCSIPMLSDMLLDVLNDYLGLSSGWSCEANEHLADKMNNGLGRVMFYIKD